MTQERLSPKEWIASAVPVKTVAGVEVVYNKRSYKSQYYSVDWLAETFEEQITTTDSPREEIIKECKRLGHSELENAFSNRNA